jgi:hypothetical protein
MDVYRLITGTTYNAGPQILTANWLQIVGFYSWKLFCIGVPTLRPNKQVYAFIPTSLPGRQTRKFVLGVRWPRLHEGTSPGIIKIGTPHHIVNKDLGKFQVVILFYKYYKSSWLKFDSWFPSHKATSGWGVISWSEHTVTWTVGRPSLFKRGLGQ